MTPAEFKQARKSLGLTAEQAAPLFGLGNKARIYEIESSASVPPWHALLMRAYLAGNGPTTGRVDGSMPTPITDPRPFPAVLADWISRHGGSAYAVSSGRILTASQQTVLNWLDGRPCACEREARALMTLADEGRLSCLNVKGRDA